MPNIIFFPKLVQADFSWRPFCTPDYNGFKCIIYFLSTLTMLQVQNIFQNFFSCLAPMVPENGYGWALKKQPVSNHLRISKSYEIHFWECEILPLINLNEFCSLLDSILISYFILLLSAPLNLMAFFSLSVVSSRKVLSCFPRLEYIFIWTFIILRDCCLQKLSSVFFTEIYFFPTNIAILTSIYVLSTLSSAFIDAFIHCVNCQISL